MFHSRGSMLSHLLSACTDPLLGQKGKGGSADPEPKSIGRLLHIVGASGAIARFTLADYSLSKPFLAIC